MRRFIATLTLAMTKEKMSKCSEFFFIFPRRLPMRTFEVLISSFNIMAKFEEFPIAVLLLIFEIASKYLKSVRFCKYYGPEIISP